MEGDNRPLSEIFAIVGEQWTDADAAASLLEDCQGAFLAERMLLCGDMAVSRAEMLVKASAEWRDYVVKKVDARKKANRLKVQLEQVRMRHREWIGQDANERMAARL